jgi:hypothetical protein
MPYLPVYPAGEAAMPFLIGFSGSGMGQVDALATGLIPDSIGDRFNLI